MRILRTIFAVVPSASSLPAIVAAYQALPLAERSRLIGLHMSPLAPAYGLMGDLALAPFIEAQMEAAKEEQEAASAAFDEACRGAGIESQWRAVQCIDHRISAEAGSRARAADLVVFPEPAEGASLGRHQVEELVFASGRPVLGIPLGWNGKSIGESVIVAWDGGREAARAVFDAMPFLTNAKSVRIVSVQGFMDEPVHQFTLADEIAATLSRHGIKAECTAFRSTRGSVKAELQAQMLDTGADMVVMGCYGHSRFREMVLGGVSRDVLKGLPFPVLLAS